MENVSKAHIEQMESMEDKELIDVWKVYFSKAKNHKKASKEYDENMAIAEYAMKLHKKNLEQNTDAA